MILDVDSTLCGVEGIDWLARRRGSEVAERCARLTERAMSGEIPLEQVYGERLEVIQPTLREIAELGVEYARTLAPGAGEALRAMAAAGVTIVLVSGGIRRAIESIIAQVSVPPENLFAVDLRFDASGNYAGFDGESPLTRQHGKLDVVRRLAPQRPILAVGDGSTDAEMRAATDAFAAFTGFERRQSVVDRSDLVLRSFAELASQVLSR